MIHTLNFSHRTAFQSRAFPKLGADGLADTAANPTNFQFFAAREQGDDAEIVFSNVCVARGGNDFVIELSQTQTEAFTEGRVYFAQVIDQVSGALQADLIITVQSSNITPIAPQAPGAVALSPSTVVEGAAVGAVVGTLSASGTEPLTFTIEADTDNMFELVGRDLVLLAEPDFETAAFHDVTVRVSNGYGVDVIEPLRVQVVNVVEVSAPSGLSLSALVVNDGSPIGTAVGALTASGGGAMTFSIEVDPDSMFSVSGGSLVLAAVPDAGVATSHSITIRASNGVAPDATETFVIAVEDVAAMSVVFGDRTMAGRGAISVPGATSIPSASGLSIVGAQLSPMSDGSAVAGTYTTDNGIAITVAIETGAASVSPSDGEAGILAALDMHNSTDPAGVMPFSVLMRPGNYGAVGFEDHIPARQVNIRLRTEGLASARSLRGGALDAAARISSASLKRTGAVEAEDVGSLTFEAIYFHDVATADFDYLVELLCGDVRFERCQFDHGLIPYIDGGEHIGQSIYTVYSSWSTGVVFVDCEHHSMVNGPGGAFDRAEFLNCEIHRFWNDGYRLWNNAAYKPDQPLRTPTIQGGSIHDFMGEGWFLHQDLIHRAGSGVWPSTQAQGQLRMDFVGVVGFPGIEGARAPGSIDIVSPTLVFKRSANFEAAWAGNATLNNSAYEVTTGSDLIEVQAPHHTGPGYDATAAGARTALRKRDNSSGGIRLSPAPSSALRVENLDGTFTDVADGAFIDLISFPGATMEMRPNVANNRVDVLWVSRGYQGLWAQLNSGRYHSDTYVRNCILVVSVANGLVEDPTDTGLGRRGIYQYNTVLPWLPGDPWSTGVVNSRAFVDTSVTAAQINVGATRTTAVRWNIACGSPGWEAENHLLGRLDGSTDELSTQLGFPAGTCHPTTVAEAVAFARPQPGAGVPQNAEGRYYGALQPNPADDDFNHLTGQPVLAAPSQTSTVVRVSEAAGSLDLSAHFTGPRLCYNISDEGRRDPDALAATLPVLTDALSIDPDSGLITWDPADFDISADLQFDVTVRNAQRLIIPVTITSAVGVAPSNINLSTLSVTDDSSVGATVATITSAGTAPVAFTIDDDPDGKFEIIDGELRLAATVDRAVSASHEVTIRASNGTSPDATRTFTIAVIFVPTIPPSNLELSSTSAAEDTTVGSVLATITADGDEPMTFAIEADPDGKFAVAGSTLLLNAGFNFETKVQHSVTIRATNGVGAGLTETWLFEVLDVAENVSTDPSVTAVDGDGKFATYTTPPAEMDPEGDPRYVVVTRQGYGADTLPRTFDQPLVLTKRVREPYPNQATLTVDEVALTEPVFASDTIVGLTNNSTKVAPAPNCIFATVDRQVVGDLGVVEICASSTIPINGEMIAAAVATWSDGANTATGTATVSEVSTWGVGDQAAVIVYRIETDISGLSDGLVWCDVQAYPHVGIEIADSSRNVNHSGANGNSRKWTRQYYYKQSGLISAHAYVSPTGNDGAGVVSTTEATAQASPFQTIRAAAEAMQGAQGTCSGHVITLEAGTYAGWGGATTAARANTGFLTVRGASPSDPSQVVIETTSDTGKLDVRFLTLQNLTVRRVGATSLPVATGNASPTNANYALLWVHNCIIDNAGYVGTPWLFGVTFEGYFTQTRIDNPGEFMRNQRPVNSWYRGIDVTGVPLQMKYADLIGCRFRDLRYSAGAIPDIERENGGFIAFNRFERLSQTLLLSTQAISHGFTFMQNLVEFVGLDRAIQFGAESTPPENTLENVVFIHNTVAGQGSRGRVNLFYDDLPGQVHLFTNISVRNNLFGQMNVKTDTFSATQDPANVGNWWFVFGVGSRGNVTENTLGLGGSSYRQDYAGFQSDIPVGIGSRLPIDFVDYQGTVWDGADGYADGAGGGDYHLVPGSRGQGTVTTGLRFDLDGAPRSAMTDAGCFDQASAV